MGITPLALMAKAADVAERYGPAVEAAWKTIAQALRAEHPELNQAPIPDAGAEMDRERAAALERERKLAEGGGLDDDTEDPK